MGTVPIGEHTQFDETGEAQIIITYNRRGVIEQIRLDSIDKTYHFPSKFDSISWSAIKPGLWINTIDQEEAFASTFPKSSRTKCYYAAYLLDGQAVDNSFVHNYPIESKLRHLIKGFALGIWNVPIGTVRVLKIAPQLAYKDKILAEIPPNSTLIYFIYRIE